ncbi:MAG: glycosyltransferase family 9 protein [Steroidobacteraceae bacterium]
MTVFGKIAVVKPDHIGDLILASPAIGRLHELSLETTLFVSSQNISLARHLFPDLEINALDFAHLVKGGNMYQPSPRVLQSVFSPFDTIFVLRSDAYLNRTALRVAGRPMFFTVGHPEIHETRSHAEHLYGVIGHYDSDTCWPGRILAWPSRIGRVALVVGAGFPTNRWPAWYWARIVRLLQKQGRCTLLVGGPSEVDFVATVAQIAGLRPGAAFIGSSDNISDMWALLAECDVAIASDGGSAHLASLACPVLSLFASSPHMRFAPFGRENRVVTLKLKCSPCMNAHDRQVNLCLTNECSFGILPETVLSALEAPSSLAGTSVPLKDPYGAQLVFGISHAQ